MKKSKLARITALLFAVALPQPAYAGTVTGRATATGTKIYTFIADDDGQVLMTLTWTSKSADLFMLTIDGTTDPLTWCIGAADQSRTQRCEFGAFRSQLYAIGVASFSGASKFQLNVQTSRSEFVSRAGGAGELRELTVDYPTTSQTTSTRRGGSKLDRCDGSTSVCCQHTTP